MVHCDFGITYLNLNTDCQQLAYVLKSNETDAPQFLKDGLKAGNFLEDILTNNFKEGISGNEILKISREKAIEKGSSRRLGEPTGAVFIAAPLEIE